MAQALVTKELVDDLILIVEPVSLSDGLCLFKTRAAYVLVSEGV